jgi:hypothetical protein
MAGDRLPYALRWIMSGGLEKRFHSESITRPSLVGTVKSKVAADNSMTKSLSFGADPAKPRGSGRKGKEEFVQIAVDVTTSSSVTKQPDVTSAPKIPQGPKSLSD